MSTTVQLEGVESVVAAYLSRRVPAFSVLQGRNLNFSYDGNDIEEGARELESWLTAIEKSKATYTIRFHKGSDIKGDIRSNTPDVGSLNFRLNLDPIGNGGRSIGEVPYYMEKRLADLERQNNELREMLAADESEPVPENNIIGTIKQLSEIPGFSEIVTGIVGMVAGAFNKQPVAAAIGNVPQNTEPMPQVESNTEPTQEEITRAATAYIHIRSAVPDVLEFFEKLAMMAQSDPQGLAKKITLAKTFV